MSDCFWQDCSMNKIVLIDSNNCIGCGACVEICPKKKYSTSKITCVK